MSYREVTMIEVKEVLRLWLAGASRKRIAAQLGFDVKTVRRYVRTAERVGLKPGEGLSDEQLSAVMKVLKAPAPREHGDGWLRCAAEKERIAQWLRQGVRLSKCRRLLQRQGVLVPYATLYRFAARELDFGAGEVTVRVEDGKPGEELNVDTGWMTLFEPGPNGKRQRFKAFIFTPNVSRYRFVYPVLRERTEQAIEACEAAWEFYGGVFGVLIPDNTRAIVQKADPLEPLLNRTFLEYAQSRDFVIDTTRVRKPKDKARVERTVRDVRDDCFGGERIEDLERARERALQWSTMEYGMRRHTTTQRLPREHFMELEAALLKPAPGAPYDIPLWCEPKVGRDHLAQVARALYSLPTRWVGVRLEARADSSLVRFYDRCELVKTHPRQPPGGRSIDPADYPDEKRPYALRDIAFLQAQAAQCGAAVGAFAAALLEGPLPWTRMRRVYALLGLVRRYGEQRVETACRSAIEHQMFNVKRLQKMLENPPSSPTAPAERALPPARYLRCPEQYALPGVEQGELS